MADLAIRVEGLGKRYTIGKGQAGYRTLRESIMGMVYAPLRGARRLVAANRNVGSEPEETIWALKDVSIDINRGEVVGIIGRNGAGKSTLLKILSEITEPTEGRAELHGRVGSLLEVGTGFHPELTGRENVFLNGAILGMKRAEIERKFDEIVAFAEVEKFIDTPVKHYSSGMYLRLAFAVAAHLEPEILIVDEVLAVGDAAFQKKCLGKMAGVAKEGRTVLFVSHNMPAITRLCERAILLDEGRLLQDGVSHQVVKAYLNAGLGTTAVREWRDRSKAPGGDVARLRAVRVRTEDGQCTDRIDIRKPVGLEMEYEVLKPDYRLMPNFHVYNEEGVHVFSAHEHDPLWRGRTRPPACYRSTAWIPGNLLSEGIMFVDVGLTTVEPLIIQFTERQAVAFQVIDSPDGDSARGDWSGPMAGVVRPLLKWSTDVSQDFQEPFQNLKGQGLGY
jgi:lipopolysaccharide transport system ATP-binding protein